MAKKTPPPLDPQTCPSVSNEIWVYAETPEPQKWLPVDHDLFGKWCVMRPAATIDDAWARVVALVQAGHVVTAKASGYHQAQRHGGSHLICVYTPDWRDRDAVFRVRELLRDAGFTEELGYKRDADTRAGVYATADEWTYRA